MKRLTQLSDIKQLGTILGVWAHPDDESFTCGGILAAAVRNGQRVACITATKGEAGVQDPKRWPRERLGEIRTAELARALDILGIKEHHWLGYNDGTCREVDSSEAAAKIIEHIDRIKPDTILTFGPDGMTGHPDHQTVSRWVDEALSLVDRHINVYHVVVLKRAYEQHLKKLDEVFNIFFKTDHPPLKLESECDICVDLPKDIQRKKRRALKAMPSQTEIMFTYLGDDKFDQAYSSETFVKAPYDQVSVLKTRARH